MDSEHLGGHCVWHRAVIVSAVLLTDCTQAHRHTGMRSVFAEILDIGAAVSTYITFIHSDDPVKQPATVLQGNIARSLDNQDAYI